MTDSTTRLADQIEATVSAFMAGLPAADAQVVGRSFEQLHASSIAAHALGTGQQAPDFELPNVRGETVRLSQVLERGPVVLSFYRGGWCPFCNLELRALQARLPEMQALGACLIGISPELPDHALSTAGRLELGFEVLSDAGNSTARDFGLLYTVFEEMRPLYLKWGLDVPACNGDHSWELPVPASYVIDTGGTVRAAYVNKDYTRRMEPEAIVAALRELI